MALEPSVLDEVVVLANRLCRARLANAETAVADVVDAVLQQHREDTPIHVTTLRAASQVIAAALAKDQPKPGSMQALLRGMPQLRADVLAMRVVVGASVDEVSAALCVTRSAVLIAQHRALSALRAILAS